MNSIIISELFTNRNNISFVKYLNEIKNIRVLDPDEEYELSISAKNGNKQSINKLVEHNLKFVITVAKQYATNKVKLEDLVNEGNLGLVIAANRFDPTRGFKFISYAIWWIRKKIIVFITDNGKTVRIPSNKTNMSRSVRKKYQRLEQKYEHPPTLYQILNNSDCDFTEKDIKFFLENENSITLSLDDNNENNPDFSNYFKLTKNTSGIINTDFFLTEADNHYFIESLMDGLNEKEKLVIILFYGLYGKSPLRLKEIGLTLDLTSERVRQIKYKAINKLKLKLNK